MCLHLHCLSFPTAPARPFSHFPAIIHSQPPLLTLALSQHARYIPASGRPSQYPPLRHIQVIAASALATHFERRRARKPRILLIPPLCTPAFHHPRHAAATRPGPLTYSTPLFPFNFCLGIRVADCRRRDLNSDEAFANVAKVPALHPLPAAFFCNILIRAATSPTSSRWRGRQLQSTTAKGPHPHPTPHASTEST